MQLETNNERKEIKLHGSYAFPVYVSHEMLSNYERGAFAWHWHPEVELTYIEEGEMIYQINRDVFHVKQGDGLFCNSNALHTGHMYTDNDCRYISVTFHPRLISGFEGSAVKTQYVDPIICSDSVGGIMLSADGNWQERILKDISGICSIYSGQEEGYELEIQSRLNDIWCSLYMNLWKGVSQEDSTSQYKEIERLRMTIKYIQEHYSEHVTLASVSENINICTSECCRFFKRHMNQTIFEYLLEYRIEKSLPLLIEGRENITSISQLVGFSNPAYFGKVFHQIMKCSPSEYRKSIKNSK